MRSAEHDGWWVGHYILMPDHVHLFARPEIDASLMANWMLMLKSVSSRRMQLNITIWQDDQEAARQQTSLGIRASDVTEQSRLLREVAEKQGGRVHSSSFSRDPNGREYANVALRVPIQNYAALMQSLSALGKLENLSVRRDDRTNSQIDEKSVPADISIQVYSQGNLVAEGSGLPATMRRTIEQGAGALMWSVRMIGVALAFLAPWIIALAAAIGIVRGIRRSRRHREH